MTKIVSSFSGLLCSDKGANGLSQWSYQMPLWLSSTMAKTRRSRLSLQPSLWNNSILDLTLWTQIKYKLDRCNQLFHFKDIVMLCNSTFNDVEFRWEAGNPLTQVILPLGIYLKGMTWKWKFIVSKRSFQVQVIYGKSLAKMGENQNI